MEAEDFPDSLVDEIADSIRLLPGRRPLLAKHLRDLPVFAQLCRTAKLKEAPSHLIRRVGSVSMALDRLVKRLGLDVDTMKLPDRTELDPLIALILWQVALDLDRDHPERRIEEGTAKAELEHRLDLLLRLRQSLTRVEANLHRDVKSGRGGPRRESDWAQREIICQLMITYWEVTGRKTGVSTNPFTGEIGGPFVRFVQLCLPPLGWDLTLPAIRGVLRDIKREDAEQANRPGHSKLP